MSDPTTIRHISKDHIVIVPASGYSVVVWQSAGIPEVMVSANDGSETFVLRFEPPGSDRLLATERAGDGSVHIKYEPRANG